MHRVPALPRVLCWVWGRIRFCWKGWSGRM